MSDPNSHKADLQHDAEHTNPPKHSVVPYLVILAAAAFLLLLLAFFMQQRTTDAVHDLTDQNQLFQSYDQLVTTNQSLHNEVDALEDQLATAQKELEQLKQENADLQNTCDRTTAFESVLTTLHTAEHLIANKDYDGAHALFADWDMDYFMSCLEDYDAWAAEHHGDTLTPCYKAIVEALEKHPAS